MRRAIGRQDDVVARWRPIGAGWTRHAVAHEAAARAWRRIHDGVWALGQAPLTQRQRWIAAVLTAPRTFLAAESACCCHGERGIRALIALCDRYAAVPYHRCRSDAECRALEVLHDAGVPAPDVNVRVAGREADLVWRRWKLIVEIDGPQWHPFRDRDAAKERLWRAAG